MTASSQARPGPTSSAVAVVDASVWVSRFLNTDVNHIVSERWLNSQLAAGAILASSVLLLAEVAGVIRRETQNATLAEQIVASLGSHPQLRFVPVTPALGKQSAHLAATLGLRGTDAVYAATSRRLRAPLVSWDGEHIRRAGATPPTP